IGMTPDETEIWLCDGANNRVHVFDNTVMPPVQKTSILVRDMPGWITFSVDGKYAYPSSGDVIDVKSRKIVATLEDQHYNGVQSEKMVEIQFRNGKAFAAVIEPQQTQAGVRCRQLLHQRGRRIHAAVVGHDQLGAIGLHVEIC
ncbi:MAG: hypothetical protein ABI901_06575, partial [Roseiflexaceae bacterium]